MDNLHHLCIGFDNWTQVGFDSEDPKFSFGARQLEKGAGPDVIPLPATTEAAPPLHRCSAILLPDSLTGPTTPGGPLTSQTMSSAKQYIE